MGGGLVRPCENTCIHASLGFVQSHSSFWFIELWNTDRVVTPIVGIDGRLLYCWPLKLAELLFFLLWDALGGDLTLPPFESFGFVHSHSSFLFKDLRDAYRVVTPIVGIDWADTSLWRDRVLLVSSFLMELSITGKNMAGRFRKFCGGWLEVSETGSVLIEPVGALRLTSISLSSMSF